MVKPQSNETWKIMMSLNSSKLNSAFFRVDLRKGSQKTDMEIEAISIRRYKSFQRGDDLHQCYMILMIWICVPSWFDAKSSTFAEFQDISTSTWLYTWWIFLPTKCRICSFWGMSLLILMPSRCSPYPSHPESRCQVKPGFPKNQVLDLCCD